MRSLCYSYDEGIPAHLFQMELYEETGLTLGGNHVLSLPELVQVLSPAFEHNFIWLRPTVQGYTQSAQRRIPYTENPAYKAPMLIGPLLKFPCYKALCQYIRFKCKICDIDFL